MIIFPPPLLQPVPFSVFNLPLLTRVSRDFALAPLLSIAELSARAGALSCQTSFPSRKGTLLRTWAVEKRGAALASAKPSSRFKALLLSRFIARGDGWVPLCLPGSVGSLGHKDCSISQQPASCSQLVPSPVLSSLDQEKLCQMTVSDGLLDVSRTRGSWLTSHTAGSPLDDADRHILLGCNDHRHPVFFIFPSATPFLWDWLNKGLIH